jgi:hypothetical protein
MNEKDRLDQYLEEESATLDKKYLEKQDEPSYLDSVHKKDTGYLDKINDPESQSDSSYLETIRFDYLDQDTTVKEHKIDIGYFEKEIPEKAKPTKPEPQVIKETPEQPAKDEPKQQVEPEKIIDGKPQLPQTIWRLAEGTLGQHSGVKSFSTWTQQDYRGAGKLKRVWSTEATDSLNQIWPIVTYNTWFIGPYMKINQDTGEIRKLKKPLVPEITDGYRIFGAMKLDDFWWRVAVDLENSNFSGKFSSSLNPRGSFKAVNKCLLYLDARENARPSIARLNPENCNVLWKLESNGLFKITNASTSLGSVWIFQQGAESLFTSIDPVRGIATDFSLPQYNPCDCFDFWGKFFVTTSNGVMFEYDIERKRIVREFKVGYDGYTTTFLHALDDRVVLKCTDNKFTQHCYIDPLNGQSEQISGYVPRKDGCYYHHDGRYFRKMNSSNETLWMIDNALINGVILEDERGVLTKSNQVLTLWAQP